MLTKQLCGREKAPSSSGTHPVLDVSNPNGTRTDTCNNGVKCQKTEKSYLCYERGVCPWCQTHPVWIPRHTLSPLYVCHTQTHIQSVSQSARQASRSTQHAPLSVRPIPLRSSWDPPCLPPRCCSKSPPFSQTLRQQRNYPPPLPPPLLFLSSLPSSLNKQSNLPNGPQYLTKHLQ